MELNYNIRDFRHYYLLHTSSFLSGLNILSHIPKDYSATIPISTLLHVINRHPHQHPQINFSLLISLHPTAITMETRTPTPWKDKLLPHTLTTLWRLTPRNQLRPSLCLPARRLDRRGWQKGGVSQITSHVRAGLREGLGWDEDPMGITFEACEPSDLKVHF